MNEKQNFIENTIKELEELKLEIPKEQSVLLEKINNITNELLIENSINENIEPYEKNNEKIIIEDSEEHLSKINFDIIPENSYYFNMNEFIKNIKENYKTLDKYLIQIYEFYFKNITSYPYQLKFNENNEIFISNILSEKIFLILDKEIEKSSTEEKKEIRKRHIENFKNIIKSVSIKEIGNENVNIGNDKLNINNLCDNQNKILEDIALINYKFEQKYLSRLNTKNKMDYYKLIDEFNNVKNKPTFEESINSFKLLKEKWIEEIKLRNGMIKIRKDLSYLKSVYNKEWIASIDCEYKEDNISEIGITLKNIKTKKLIVENYIIEDFMESKYKYTPFNFGITEVLPLKEALKKIELLMEKSNVLVGNAIDKDIELLYINGLDLRKKFLFDLNKFNSYFNKSLSKEHYKKLSDFTYSLGIEGKNFHNAGNDSYYSVRCFFRLMEKYLNMDFKIPENFENLSEKEIEKDNTKDNIFRKIYFLKKRLHYKNDNEWKKIPAKKLKFTEMINLSDVSYFFKENIKNKKDELEFIKNFKIQLNTLNDKVNLMNIDNDLYMDIENYFLFINNLMKVFDKRFYQIKDIEDKFIYLLTKQNTIPKKYFVYQKEDKFNINFYNENNVKLTYHSNLQNFDNELRENKLSYNEELEYKLKNLNDKNILNIVKYKEYIKKLSEESFLKEKSYLELSNLLNSTISDFTFDEMPIDIYNKIINYMFDIENKKTVIENFSKNDVKNRRMIDVYNIKEIFSNQNIKDLEDFFIPEKNRMTGVMQKVNYYYLDEHKSVFYDVESFIYLIKVYCNSKHIKIEKEEIKNKVINYISKYSLKSLHFHQELQKSELNRNIKENNENKKLIIPLFETENGEICGITN